MAEAKAKFRNNSAGHVGVTVINEEGRKDGKAVGPGDTIWLSEREQVMTADAPRDPANNPFVGGGQGGGPALVVETEMRETPSTNRQIGGVPAVAPLDGEDAGETAGEDPDESPKPTRQRRSKRQSDETGAAAQPAGDPPEGEYGTGEEVGTPEAAKT